MSRHSLIILSLFAYTSAFGQVRWQNVDSQYQPLPASVHVYKTTDSLDGQPNVAFYVIADLKDKSIDFTVDTTHQRRLTPEQFYQKNAQPLVVVNSTFFSFATNKNLNVVVKDGRVVSFNQHSLAGRGKDTLTYRHTFGSALGISKKRKADVAWTFTDSTSRHVYALQSPMLPLKDSILHPDFDYLRSQLSNRSMPYNGTDKPKFRKWKMKTANGGGPVLVQNGEIKVTNNEELKFAGRGINDKHPRTAMGYTRDNKLIILVVQGRSPGTAEGVTLTQEAQMLKDLGCVEALNLDGGGSSCLLVNGKETITPSDKGKQRAIPAVFMIKNIH